MELRSKCKTSSLASSYPYVGWSLRVLLNEDTVKTWYNLRGTKYKQMLEGLGNQIEVMENS